MPDSPLKPDTWSREEKAHKAAERTFWAVQGRLSLASFAVSVVTLLCLAGTAIFTFASLIGSADVVREATDAAVQARRQADAMVYDQRPWIKSTLGLTGILTNPDGSVEIMYDIRTQNVGRSPAEQVHVHITASAMQLGDMFHLGDAEKAQCASPESSERRSGIPGDFLFPDEYASSVYGDSGTAVATIDRADMAAARKSAIPLGFTIVGCTDYTLPSGAQGLSGFAYQITDTNIDDSHGFPSTPGFANLHFVSFKSDMFNGGYFR